jgi:hypothetical protein
VKISLIFGILAEAIVRDIPNFGIFLEPSQKKRYTNMHRSKATSPNLM